MRRFAALFLLAVLGTVPLAADPPVTQQQAAEAVVKAVGASDAAALEALARRDDPDPWLVTDELIGRGEIDAAAAFAKAVPRIEVEALAGYVEGRRATPEDPERRKRLAGYNALVVRQQFEAAREALGPREPAPIGDVLGIRLLFSHAMMGRQLGEASAQPLLLEVGEAALRLGWLRRATDALHDAGVMAFLGGDMQAARAAWEQERAAWLRRKNPRRAAQAAATVGTAALNQGDDAGAAQAQLQALEVPEALDEEGGAIAVRNSLVDVLTRLDRHAEALAQAQVLLREVEASGNEALLSGVLMSLGTAQRFTGDLAGAAATFERVLPRLEAQGNARGVAAVRSDLGQVWMALGQHTKARTVLEQALSGLKTAGDRGYAAVTQAALGEAAFLLGELDLALASAEESRVAFEALGMPHRVAEGWSAIGRTREARGEWTESASAYQQAEAAYAALGEQAVVWAMRSALASVRVHQGKTAEAAKLWEEVIAAQEASTDRAGLVKSLCEYASLRSDLGDYRPAAELVARAVAVAEAAGDAYIARMARSQVGRLQYRQGEYPEALATWGAVLEEERAADDPMNAASTLSNLGLVHSALGDHAAALDVYGRALVLQRQMSNRSNATITLANLASVHFHRGDLAQALSAYEEALASYEALGQPEGVASMLCAIGGVFLELGDDDRALAFQRRAHAAFEALDDPLGALGPLSAIAYIERERGEAAAARATLERAIAQEDARGNRPSSATLRVELGRALADLGEEQAAVAVLGEARARGEALHAPPITVAALLALGSVLVDAKRPQEARAELEAALAILAESGSQRESAPVLGLLAQVYADLGDPQAALASARRAVTASGARARGLGAEEGARVREPLEHVYESGLRAALLAKDPGAVAWFLESGRAGALLEGLKARETLWAAAVPAELRVAEGRARAAETLATEALAKAGASGDKAVVRARRQALDAARDEVARVIGRIQREAKAGAALVAPEARDLAGIQAALAPDDALVLYGVDAQQACALVVRPDGARIVPLGLRKDLADAVGALHLSSADGDATDPLAALAQRVIAPLALGPTTKRVLVSPAGPLALVPFAALLPDVPVVYVPSGTTYALLRDEPAPRGAGILALGDPDYASKAAVAVRGGKALASLPGTRAEALAVGTVTLLGGEASEAGLRATLSQQERWRAVHFACHGLVNPDRPALSALALSADATEDGMLMALDVFRMRIPADLVVLSACETARGAVVATEGIVGLTRAFMFAGAPRVLCSLWKVDDEATAALMTKFYELWHPKDGKPGLPTAEALRAAQSHVRAQERWKHPYYWAAWVLWGLPS